MLPRSVLLLLVCLALPLPLSAEVRDLKAFYQMRCAVCHGADGSGRGPGGLKLGGRNLLDARWLAKQAEADLARSILKGRGAMPGYRRQLSESEARQLLTDVLRPLKGRRRP